MFLNVKWYNLCLLKYAKNIAFFCFFGISGKGVYFRFAWMIFCLTKCNKIWSRKIRMRIITYSTKFILKLSFEIWSFCSASLLVLWISNGAPFALMPLVVWNNNFINLKTSAYYRYCFLLNQRNKSHYWNCMQILSISNLL